jgi:hypothetical protein
MRTRALAALATTVILSSVAVAPAGAGSPAQRATTLHWKTFVQFNGAKLQGCVERPAGSDTRTMHFRHDTRQANGPTKVKVTENFNGILAILWKDALTEPGHLITSGRIGFKGEQHLFKGAIITRSGAQHTNSVRISFFPTC